jgi:lysyl-tRNA synthetase class 2
MAPTAIRPVSDLRETRLEKVSALRDQGREPYALTFDPTDRMARLQTDHADLPKGEERDCAVAVAGRVMTRRVMGKLAFFTLADETGTIQLFLEKAALGEAFAQITSLVDAGDLIGVRGTLRRTDRGELSVKVAEWTMLTKSLQPLPDKWHGLADVEKRYRQRYLDLIVSPQSRETFRRRALTVSAIRRWLDEREFLEIETPVLQSEAGGADARPFITHHNTLHRLRVASHTLGGGRF